VKILVEPIYKTNQLLVRLLGSDVQTGSYILDATPAIPEVKSFEVFAGMVRQEEARLYFTGFAKFPDSVKVTLPDSTQQTITLVEVILPKTKMSSFKAKRRSLRKKSRSSKLQKKLKRLLHPKSHGYGLSLP
jgi:hypothetical protein